MIKNYWTVLILIILILVLSVIFSFYRNKIQMAQVIINGHEFNVELAKTETEREKGLMGRTSLDINNGMLFIFDKSDVYSFWMKDTKMPLDIIWINYDPSNARASKIVEITTLNPQNGHDIPKYTPQNIANYVLEINAGTVARYGFKIGDNVAINY